MDSADPETRKPVVIAPNVLVFEMRAPATEATSDAIRHRMKEAFPDHRCVVLQQGIRLATEPVILETLNRIEAKLDSMLSAIAAEQDGEEDGPRHDLEGNQLPRDRTDGDTL